MYQNADGKGMTIESEPSVRRVSCLPTLVCLIVMETFLFCFLVWVLKQSIKLLKFLITPLPPHSTAMGI